MWLALKLTLLITIVLLGILVVRAYVLVNEQLDRAQMQQVLTKLVVNAIHTTTRGAIRVSWGWRYVPSPHGLDAPLVRRAILALADGGTGIEPELLPRISAPFMPSEAVVGGTGLGRSVSHGSVEQHGGWIDVKTERGGGSLFTVYLSEEAGG